MGRKGLFFLALGLWACVVVLAGGWLADYYPRPVVIESNEAAVEGEVAAKGIRDGQWQLQLGAKRPDGIPVTWWQDVPEVVFKEVEVGSWVSLQ